MTLVSAFAQDYDIKIHNRIDNLPYAERTNIDAGPATGNILNAHYFPGLIDYQRGNYRGAKSQMDYFLARPQYTQMNPRQREFFSHGYYIRGMIYLYHASGYGRFVLAKKDFEQSIRWDVKNYASHLQLSRVMYAVGLKDKAIDILQNLLKINSDAEIEKLIKEEVSKIDSTN
jgi:tetratricopeptide (TPR) repeat protein